MIDKKIKTYDGLNELLKRVDVDYRIEKIDNEAVMVKNEEE